MILSHLTANRGGYKLQASEDLVEWEASPSASPFQSAAKALVVCLVLSAGAPAAYLFLESRSESRPAAAAETTVITEETLAALPAELESAPPAQALPAEPIRAEIAPAAVEPPTGNTAPAAQPAESPALIATRSLRAGWYVQVAAASRVDGAAEIAALLKTDAFDALLEDASTAQKSIFRVILGPHRSRAEAQRTQAHLADVPFLDGTLLRHIAG